MNVTAFCPMFLGGNAVCVKHGYESRPSYFSLRNLSNTRQMTRHPASRFFLFAFPSSLQVGSAKERSPGSSMVGNSGEKAALLEPTRQLQTVHDHGNQSKGTVASSDVSLARMRNSGKL